MIRSIAAIDEKRGLATDDGIPWDLPSDKQYFRDQTREGIILMGMGTYREFSKPMHDRANYVATSQTEPLRDGFVAVGDVPEFFAQHEGETIQNIGGAGLFTSTLDFADELLLTQIQADFHCTKFFPEYTQDFELVQESEPVTENGITFRFQTWRRKAR